MTTKVFDSRGRLVGTARSNPDPAATTRLVRVLNVLALLTVLVPLRSSGWVSLALGGHWISPFGLLWLTFVGLAVWRIVIIVRDAGRLDAPAYPGPLRWGRHLGVALMVLGIASFVLQFFVGPIGRAMFPRGSDNGVEFFVIGVWFAIFAASAPAGLCLFETSRLLGFERAYREQRA